MLLSTREHILVYAIIIILMSTTRFLLLYSTLPSPTIIHIIIHILIIGFYVVSLNRKL